MNSERKARAKQILQELSDRIPDLKQRQSSSPEFNKWNSDAKRAIANIFGESSHRYKEFAELRYSRGVYGFYDGASQRAYVAGLDKAQGLFDSMVEEMDGAFDI